MAHLKLQLLGRFQLSYRQQPIERFRSDKVRALLAYLAAEPVKQHTRVELATLLWGELGDKAARANLRKSLFRLRQTLGDAATEHLNLTNTYVQFCPETASIDVHQFAQLARSTDLTELEQAIELHQGQFLAGLELAGAPAFDDWLAQRRERLRQQLLDLLFKTGQLYLVNANYEAARTVAERQLALEPWREMAHQQLVKAYAAAGQRAKALRQHEQFVAILEAELGLAPSADTETLIASIRDDASPANRQHNFPVPQTPFVGRTQDVNRLTARLALPNTRLITLTGPGGVGKTRLAIEAVTRSMGHRHVYFVPLERLTTQEGVWQRLAERLGIQSRMGSRIEREVIASLREHAPLLVFDNYEQLLPLTTCIERLLNAAPEVQILVTSRAPLNLQAEWRLPVSGLMQPSEAERNVADFSAVQLLLLVGQQVMPELRLSAENSAHFGRICRALAGMPLALEMAGSWLALFSPAQLADEIERNLDFLVATRSDMPARHRSLRAIFDHTVALLTPTERDLLRQLTIFHSDFSLKAVRTIVGCEPLTLYKLIDHALVQRRSADHFSLHPVLDAFLCEEDSLDLTQKRQQHASYYLQRISPICDYNVEVTVKDISYELANVCAAWTWAVSHDAGDLLEPAIDGQLAYYQFRGSYVEGRKLFATAAERISAPEQRDHLRFAEATCLQQLGDLPGAIEIVQQLATPSSGPARLPALIRLGELYTAQRAYGLALATLHAAQALADPDSALAASIWTALGLVHALQQETEASVAAHQTALNLYTALGNELLSAENHAHLAMTYRDAAQYDQALDHIEQAVAIARRLGHKGNMSRYIEQHGSIYWQCGNLRQAQRCWEQALALSKTLNHQRNMLRLHERLATSASRTEQHTQALKHQQMAQQLAEQLA